tara:strand:- start:907 stop:2481 length:1575 start_codon:yes stop_codon:yes gene_type:complete
MSFELSKEEILREVVKSGKDPAYFINNYCRISHPMRGLIPFKMYDFQRDLIHEFRDYRFNVILKARQLGISTVTAAYVAWLMLFHRDKNVLVIATKFGTASNLVKKVKAMIKNLPDWMQITSISIDNRASFELSNGSQIKASSTSGDAGRSEALSLLVIDEAAHVEGLEELWTGLYPTLSTGGRCIALSTPNGVGNWFHETYTKAESGENDFNLTMLPWDVHPDRDQEWFKKETRNMSKRQIAQELECNFNMSGETVFSPDQIQYIKQMCEDPRHRTGFDRNLWIWREYEKAGKYFISADVARGDGKDFSVFHVFRVDTNEIVAEYKGKPTPDIFAEVLISAGKEYGNALLVVENNTVGFSVLEKLVNRGYPSIYYSKKGSHEYVEGYIGEYMTSAIPGFSTTQKTRPLIIAKMEEFVRNKLIKIYSRRTVSEMEQFIWKSGRPQASRKSNDDLIMASAIGCWVRETVFDEIGRGEEYREVMLSCMVRNPTSLNTSIPGMIGHRPVEDKSLMDSYREFSWLLKG